MLRRGPFLRLGGVTTPLRPSPPLAQIVARMEADARQGNRAALATLAALAAGGLGMPQSWSGALDRLAQAARLGSQAAQGQLLALGADPGLGAGDRWGELAASVRLDAWAAAGAATILSDAPRVAAIPGFLTPAVCRWLVAGAVGRVSPARIYGASGAGQIDPGRSNSALELGPLNCDVVMHLVRWRIAAAMGVEVSTLENPQILHYAVGQSFAPHVDYLDPAHPDVAARGQRHLTFLVYLNDGFEGGETDFSRLGVRRAGAVGEALWFANVDAAGKGDPRTLHAGLAPTRGEKWLLSQWIRTRPRPLPV